MTESLNTVLDWVRLNPSAAGVAVFLLAFLESLAIVGSIVPGVAILFGIGAMIGAGALDFWHMCAWAVVGAILGDGLSFWFGHRYQHRLRALWPFSKHPSTLERGIAFFEKYGALSVAIGRFFGPIRAVIPLVAGMMDMKPRLFLLANVASALVWAPVYLLPGTLVGASLDMASEVAMRLAMLLFTLLMLLWFMGWLAHRLFLLVQPHAQEILTGLLRLGSGNRVLSRIAGALADPRHPEAGGLAMLAGLLMLAAVVFIVANLLPGAWLARPEQTLRLAHEALRSPTGDHLMLALSSLGDKTTGLAILPAVWAILRFSSQPLAARHWLAGYGLAWLVALITEALLASQPSLLHALPDVYLLRVTTLYPLLAILCSSALPAGVRWIPYSVAAMLVSVVVLAQAYHGSGLSPMLQGLCLGLVWTTAVGMAYRTHTRRDKKHPRAMLGASLVGVLLGILAVISTPRPHAMPDLATPGFMQQSDWWAEGWQKLPSYRDNLGGSSKDRLNLQYHGSLERLESELMAQGWAAVSDSLSSRWLGLLSSPTDLASLPTLPRSHAAKFESRQYVRVVGDQRQVIFLWPAQVLLEPSGKPVWLGEIGQQQAKHLLGMFSYPTTLHSDQLVGKVAGEWRSTPLRVELRDSGQLLLLSE